ESDADESREPEPARVRGDEIDEEQAAEEPEPDNAWTGEEAPRRQRGADHQEEAAAGEEPVGAVRHVADHAAHPQPDGQPLPDGVEADRAGRRDHDQEEVQDRARGTCSEEQPQKPSAVTLPDERDDDEHEGEEKEAVAVAEDVPSQISVGETERHPDRRDEN